jgi:hypothetical protein
MMSITCDFCGVTGAKDDGKGLVFLRSNNCAVICSNCVSRSVQLIADKLIAIKMRRGEGEPCKEATPCQP